MFDFGLLALHGVSREEVESYLRLSDGASIPEAYLPSLLWSMVNHQCGTSETKSSLLLSSAESWGHTQSRYVDDEHTDVDSQFAPHRQHTCTTRHSEIKDLDTRNLERSQLPIPKVAEEDTDLQGPSGSDDIIYTCSDINPSGYSIRILSAVSALLCKKTNLIQ